MNTDHNIKVEISWVDICRLFIKRWISFSIAFGSIIIVGIIIAFMMPIKYQYTLSVEVGYRVIDARTIYHDPPETARVKIEKAYLPEAARNNKSAKSSNVHYGNIKVILPRNSTVLILEVLSTETESAQYLDTMRYAANKLVKDNGLVVEVIRSDLDVRKQIIISSLDSMEKRLIALAAKKNRLNKRTIQLRNKIANLSNQVKKTLLVRDALGNGGKSQNEAIVMDNKIQHYRLRLDNYEEELLIKNSNEYDLIDTQLDDTKKKITNMQVELKNLEFSANNIRETRLLAEPVRSVNTSGKTKAAIIAVTVFIGILGGMFSVYMREFISKVTEQYKASNK